MISDTHHPYPSLFAWLAVLSIALLPSNADTIEELIDRAGNAPTDRQCLHTLRELRALPNLPSDIQAGADRMIQEIESWITNPRIDYFGGKVYTNGRHDFGIADSSPLRPIADIYQARMVLWVTLEYGGFWSVPEKRRERFDTVRALFERAATRFPKNPILQMYLGTPIPPERTIEPDPNAPGWANAQRESIERLTDIIHWWIDRRMQPDGQYGGGWGDDCEMWRWWAPILIGFDDPKIVDAQARFSRALLAQPHMAAGYTDRVFDAEHTSEDSADTLTPMMLVRPDDPEWRARALRIAELMRDLWTGKNDRGQLQFKSSYYSGKEVDLSPKRAVDNFYNVRAVQPALLLWQRTRDPELTRLFTGWMDTWIDASMRAERGKPAGIVPSAIHWPDGKVGGIGEHWWDPENHSSDPLYVWPGAMSLMLHAMLLTHHMTGDTKYVAPIRAMADLLTRRAEEFPAVGAEGGEAWCYSKMKSITPALGKHWMLTGSKDYEALLVKQGPAYLQFRISGKRDALTAALAQTAAALRVNFPGYTSEVRYTDRVLRFPSIFGENGMWPDPRPGIETPDTELLYSCVTGDPSNPQVFPLNAVRWLTPPRDIAALVTKSGPNEFEAELYHFGGGPRTIDALLPLLAPGSYVLTLREQTRNGPSVKLLTETLSATDAPTRVAFELPPRQSLVIDVKSR